MTGPTDLEPYAVRLLIEGRLDDPPQIVAGLVTDVAERCSESGASLIGHIKCHGRTPAGSFHCHLTSLRSGAECGGATAAARAPATRIELALAVLVYGLECKTLCGLTRTALDSVCAAEGLCWAVAESPPAHEHENPAHGLREPPGL